MEFSKSDRYSGAGHEYRSGIVRGLENRLTPPPPKQTSPSPDLYTVPWKEGFRCLRYNTTPPRRGLHLLSKPSPSSEGSRRHCREELLPKGKEGKGRRILYVAGIPRTLCKCGSSASPVLPLLPGVSFRVYHLSGSDLSRTRSLLGHVHSFAIFGIVKLCLPRRHASNRVVSIN